MAVAIIIGIFWLVGRKKDPVNVYEVSNFNDYYGSSKESGGTVTTDKMQSIYASDTQQITEILVEEGQTVKAGDPLVSYDTTLSEIQLEKQDIAVKQAELDLQNAKKELAEINAMKPYVPAPAPEPTPNPEPEPEPTPVDKLPYFIKGNGTEQTPYYYLCDDGMSFDDAWYETMLGDSAIIWAVFEVRENNSLAGEILSTWGMKVTRITDDVSGDSAIYWNLFLPSEDSQAGSEDDTPIADTDDSYFVDSSSGYTSAEIAQMRTETQAKIKELDVTLRLQQVELKRMQAEAAGDKIYAEVDGTVMTVLSQEEATATGSPVVVVSGGGCYYINATIGEFDLEELHVGDTVRVTEWESGGEYEGTIESISDTPTSNYNGYYSEGNNNISYYSAVIAVDASASLRAESYVSVYFDNAGSGEEHMILQNMFILNENGKSYVYRSNDDGKLEKCYIETGRSYWGQSTEILSGLTLEDYIAFPYGDNIVEGAPTVQATVDELYDYGY